MSDNRTQIRSVCQTERSVFRTFTVIWMSSFRTLKLSANRSCLYPDFQLFPDLEPLDFGVVLYSHFQLQILLQLLIFEK